MGTKDSQHLGVAVFFASTTSLTISCPSPQAGNYNFPRQPIPSHWIQENQSQPHRKSMGVKKLFTPMMVPWVESKAKDCENASLSLTALHPLWWGAWGYSAWLLPRKLPELHHHLHTAPEYSQAFLRLLPARPTLAGTRPGSQG